MTVDAPRGVVPGVDRVRVRPADERALLEDGLLLDLWQPEGRSGRHVALATDVDRVRLALDPRYGPFLEVKRSRYDETALHTVESLIVDSGLALAFGRDHGPDLQLRVHATLVHLPTTLALRLSQWPRDILALNVLGQPVERPA